jgi:hypothetical protein
MPPAATGRRYCTSRAAVADSQPGIRIPEAQGKPALDLGSPVGQVDHSRNSAPVPRAARLPQIRWQARLPSLPPDSRHSRSRARNTSDQMAQDSCVRNRPGSAGQRGCRVHGALAVHRRRQPGRPASPDHRRPHDRQPHLRRWVARAGARTADISLRARGRSLLRSADSARPQTTDRIVMYQLSHAASADAPGGWPP